MVLCSFSSTNKNENVVLNAQDHRSHLSQLLFAAAVQQVLAHFHQLSKENITHLKETSAGGFHQGLKDGADIRLDAHL